jgi:hypothetical protein
MILFGLISQSWYFYIWVESPGFELEKYEAWPKPMQSPHTAWAGPGWAQTGWARPCFGLEPSLAHHYTYPMNGCHKYQKDQVEITWRCLSDLLEDVHLESHHVGHIATDKFFSE